MKDELISRRAAVDLFRNDSLEWDIFDGYIAPHLARRMICELPSAQPEPCEDAISRQDAIGEVVAWLKDLMSDKKNGKPLTERLKALPSAQPEHIRCKDCKYMTEHYDTDGNVPYWTCSEWDSGTDYDGFCHYAERRTDE